MVLLWWWVGIGITAVISVLGAASLWWLVPKWQMRSVTGGTPKDRADIEDNFRKTIGQALGGIAVLIGAGTAYYGTQQTLQVNEDESRRSLQASDQQSQRNLEASRALLISQQVSKGFEDIGNKDAIMVRLGGIYALEGVMNTSNQYHWPVLEALCAFVLDGTKTHAGEDPPAIDIQAALSVIGRRQEVPGYVALGPDYIILTEAKVPKALLMGANLRSVYLNKADLTDANLNAANLNKAVLTDANLSAASLRVANLTGASLYGANLAGAHLDGAKLNHADLRGAYLRGVDLSGSADLTGADLTGADLRDADLRGAKLPGANLRGANLSHADLRDVDLSGSADLTGANLTGANLRGSGDMLIPNNSDATVGQSQLDQACGVDATLPASMTLKPCPPP
jgi:uncharacterized protein YjbI with pentapeptide repeats